MWLVKNNSLFSIIPPCYRIFSLATLSCSGIRCIIGHGFWGHPCHQQRDGQGLLHALPELEQRYGSQGIIPTASKAHLIFTGAKIVCMFPYNHSGRNFEVNDAHKE